MSITRKTTMSYLFPTDTCVVACSGPSLNKVDVFSLGLPVCAISTTIRSINKPNYWFIADNLNEMHGQEGKIAWDDPDVIKVVPNKTTRTPGKHVIQHPYHEGREANQKYESLLFDPSTPLLRGPHKTLTFAIQWLHVSGVKNLIFAGNDLTADNFESKYSYPIAAFDKKKEHNFKKTLDQTAAFLQTWYPVAKNKGYNWYSWECGSAFENMGVPKYTPEVSQGAVFRETKFDMGSYQAEEPSEIPKNKESEQENNMNNYFRLMRETRQKEKEKPKPKLNMGVYFDMMHKRKK